MSGASPGAAGPRRRLSRSLLGRLLLGLCASAVAVFGASRVLESCFFDRIYYQKSQAHGYVRLEPGVPFTEYIRRSGDRGRSLALFYEATGLQPGAGGGSTADLHPESEDFTIVAFGDSLCWGQGVRDHQRWPHLLEKRLDRIRPTSVLSLCEPGEQLLDILTKYMFARHVWPADLYLFTLVSDDLLVRRQGLPRSPDLTRALDPCWELAMAGETWGDEALDVAYSEGSAARCILERSLPFYPQDRSLVVDYGPPFHNGLPVDRVLAQPFRDAGFSVATLVPDPPGPDGEFHSRYFVSAVEIHPSVWSHRRFAEALAEVVAADPRFQR